VSDLLLTASLLSIYTLAALDAYVYAIGKMDGLILDTEDMIKVCSWNALTIEEARLNVMDSFDTPGTLFST
jgi:hypothetical protein